MTEFFQMLTDPDVPFLRNALLVGILASVAFGITGTYVVTKRISYIAGAVSHCVLGGIGAALYLKGVHGFEWAHPMLGAFAAAIFSALLIGLVSMYAKQREDTVIGAIWAVGMASGLLFLYKTPGYLKAMAMGYLFGDITMISPQDIWIVLILDIIVLLITVIFYRKFLAVNFDEEFARLRGVNVRFYYLLLLCIVAVTIVLLVNLAGVVLVIALLTLPPAIAGFFSGRLWQMMIFSVILGIIFNTAGFFFSNYYDLPGGPSIVAVAGICYLLFSIGACFRKGS